MVIPDLGSIYKAQQYLGSTCEHLVPYSLNIPIYSIGKNPKVSSCSSATSGRRKGAVVTSGPWADTSRMPLPALPSAEPRGCARSRAPAAEFCIGEDGALLGDTFFLAAVECCGLLPVASLPAGFPERERPWPSASQVGDTG